MSGECLTISLSGGVPWGFRLQGGAGTNQPLTVSKVRRRSKSYRRLKEGDEIVTVNEHSCSGLTYDQVMEIADRSDQQLTLVVRRSECNKENQAPEVSSNRIEQKQKTEELTLSSETTTKATNEQEGLRIQSATLLPSDHDPLKKFSSPKWAEEKKTSEQESAQPFAPFRDLEESLKTEKTSTKEERQKVSSETTEHKTTVGDMPDITLDTIDLNNLISATQRKLEDFRPGGASPDMFMEGRNSPGYSKLTVTTTESQIRTEISKNVTTTLRSGSEVSQEKKSETKQTIQDVPISIPSVPKAPPEPKISPEKKTLPEKKAAPLTLEEAYKECFKEMQRLDSQPFSTSLPDVLPEINTQQSESSYETTETPFGTTTTFTKKKKMFSSSSFYEEPQSIYPTVEEQVEMAKKIASSLADDINSKSKGSSMFHKRVKRSTKWIHEGPEPSDESAPSTPEILGVEPPTPDPSQVPFRPSKAPSKLKLVLDPRHPLDAISLKSSGLSISEHNVVSPEVCHGLVKDLHSPVGKGAALFAKRKKKSEEWVVDEEKVRNLLREQERRSLLSSPAPPFGVTQHPLARQDSKLIKKSPWEAAMENPYGFCDAAWVSPDQLADTVIRAADQKRASVERSLTSPTPQPITPVAAMHDIYHAKAPKGWQGNLPASTSPAYFPSSTPVICPEPSSFTSGYQPQTPTRPAYQNFNAVPRLWKGTTAH